MKNLLNPKWIFIINTLPVALLFFIFYGEFQIIHSLLPAESISLWKSFGLALAILGLVNVGYGVYLTIKKQSVSVFYGFIALLCYIPFIYLYGYNSESIIPFSIPQWMIPGNMILYVGTFLMPTLAYSLFVLVVHFTSDTKEHKAGKSFLIAIIIPIFWFLFSQIMFRLKNSVESFFSIHLVFILLISGTILFLFFLVRGILILVNRKAEIWRKYELAWKIPVSIVLPLLGLSVNNGHLFNNFSVNDSGVFGDFTSYWFYLIAIVNGFFICLPDFENKLFRLFVFIGRSITFAYTFYFFIVFLPFLPLSIVAMVAVGTGFLMLTPLLLFVLHVNELSKDFIFLKSFYSKNLVWSLSIAGFLVIPVFITVDYLKDKHTLNQTLEYLYTPDYSKAYNINKASLQNTLNVVNSHKENNRGGIFGSQQPYLSAYFNWLVLDNLTLSDSKINTIEKIFSGKKSFDIRPDNIQKDSVELTNVATNSTYDTSQKAWKSWINLELTNKNFNAWNAEYLTAFELPEGAWISDYYLYVGNKKEMGLLAEKKSALWVFSNIRNENRDPGILYYLTGNKVAFRVFPFAKGEIRKTGFEIVHKEPIQFSIDKKLVSLGKSEAGEEKGFENKNAIYVSAKEKQKLKKVKRKPYFHFIVNATQKENVVNFANRLEAFAREHRDLTENAKVSFVNSYVSTTLYDNNWQRKFAQQNFEGGFYADRAIKSAFFNSYKEQTNSYPVIVVVTDSLKNAVFENDFSDWSFSFPETNLFYNLMDNGTLESHSLTSKPYESVIDTTKFSFENTVLEYRLKDNSIRYLPYNKKASIILKSDIVETNESEISEKNWSSALTMQAKWVSQILHPEISDKEWLNLVKYSFRSKIMTPVTSYLVVENEAQKAILKKKQEQVLLSNKSLDLGEDTQRMSEPGLIVMIIVLGLLLWYRENRKKELARN